MGKASKAASVREELEAIRKKGKGMLSPEKVVEFARDESTALHECFDWSDDEAAHKWRIHQARNLIRVQVDFVGDKHDTPIRAFVSLVADRNNGGYRGTVDVLSEPDHRQALLYQAMEELETFQRKYAAIKELAKVFDEIRRAKSRVSRKAA